MSSTAMEVLKQAAKLDQEAWVVLAIAGGVATHLLCNRREPTFFGFVGAVSTGAAALCSLWTVIGEVALDVAVKQTAITLATFLTTLALSIIIYRNSPLHPLYKIPGPVLARTTQWWWLYQNYKFHPRDKLMEVHAKYGDFVRLGPNEVSCAGVDSIQTIQGSSGFGKTKAYQHGLLTSWTTEADSNLIAIRSHANHAIRRKVWDKGFSSTALPQYHPMLVHRSTELLRALSKCEGKPTNMHKWSGFFVYDILGDLAFGGGYGLLEAGVDTDNVLQTIVNANALHALIECIPWIKPIFTMLPASAEIKTVFALSRKKFVDRFEKGATDGVKDIFSYLAEKNEKGETLEYEVLAKESQLIVGAGADTTRTSLTMAMLYLTQHKDIFKRLQAELDDILSHSELTPAAVEKAPLLNAVIHEILRLAPPITIGIKRCSPGAMVGPYFLPNETTVRNPTWVFHHDPRYFSPAPNDFRPDRFIKPSKEERFNGNAFIPFATGPFACVGKQVALQELRMTISSIVATFDTKFAPGFDPTGYLDRAHDRFLFEFDEPMEVIFTKRQGVDHGIMSHERA